MKHKKSPIKKETKSESKWEKTLREAGRVNQEFSNRIFRQDKIKNHA